MNWKMLLDFTVGFVVTILSLVIVLLPLWIVLIVLQPPWTFVFVVGGIGVIGGVVYAWREQE